MFKFSKPYKKVCVHVELEVSLLNRVPKKTRNSQEIRGGNKIEQGNMEKGI